ncbi:hypothetical protein M0813_23902 [Anaeramoeba flamelloides]|uniref:PH domain-containing protein n=1 Tax=Anaeramoeba flamelloides TaxID=1746091 RepID=A0ABQ8Y880_9EUKA|nr:hypothetical protein M0813_23902 [Anaeramoeba flamelloides]
MKINTTPGLGVLLQKNRNLQESQKDLVHKINQFNFNKQKQFSHYNKKIQNKITLLSQYHKKNLLKETLKQESNLNCQKLRSLKNRLKGVQIRANQKRGNNENNLLFTTTRDLNLNKNQVNSNNNKKKKKKDSNNGSSKSESSNTLDQTTDQKSQRMDQRLECVKISNDLFQRMLLRLFNLDRLCLELARLQQSEKQLKKQLFQVLFSLSIRSNSLSLQLLGKSLHCQFTQCENQEEITHNLFRTYCHYKSQSLILQSQIQSSLESLATGSKYINRFLIRKQSQRKENDQIKSKILTITEQLFRLRHALSHSQQSIYSSKQQINEIRIKKRKLLIENQGSSHDISKLAERRKNRTNLIENLFINCEQLFVKIKQTQNNLKYYERKYNLHSQTGTLDLSKKQIKDVNNKLIQIKDKNDQLKFKIEKFSKIHNNSGGNECITGSGNLNVNMNENINDNSNLNINMLKTQQRVRKEIKSFSEKIYKFNNIVKIIDMNIQKISQKREFWIKRIRILADFETLDKKIKELQNKNINILLYIDQTEIQNEIIRDKIENFKNIYHSINLKVQEKATENHRIGLHNQLNLKMEKKMNNENFETNEKEESGIKGKRKVKEKMEGEGGTTERGEMMAKEMKNNQETQNEHSQSIGVNDIQDLKSNDDQDQNDNEAVNENENENDNDSVDNKKKTLKSSISVTFEKTSSPRVSRKMSLTTKPPISTFVDEIYNPYLKYSKINREKIERSKTQGMLNERVGEMNTYHNVTKSQKFNQIDNKNINDSPIKELHNEIEEMKMKRKNRIRKKKQNGFLIFDKSEIIDMEYEGYAKLISISDESKNKKKKKKKRFKFKKKNISQNKYLVLQKQYLIIFPEFGIESEHVLEINLIRCKSATNHEFVQRKKHFYKKKKNQLVHENENFNNKFNNTFLEITHPEKKLILSFINRQLQMEWKRRIENLQMLNQN